MAGENYYLPRLSDDAKSSVETALGMTWDTVGKISIGEEVITRQVNQFNASEDTRTDSRIEYFEKVNHQVGDGYHYEFLGTVELRDGFIEVRDSNWNEVFRAIDVTAAKTLDEIAADHPGFSAAWTAVGGFLPANLQDAGVRFTSDDWNIYAFSAAGELVSNINFWNGEHTWTGWDGTEYKNVDTHFNFHDDQWNSLANSGTFERYIVVADGDDILDETGSHSGYTISDAGTVATIISELNAG